MKQTKRLKQISDAAFQRQDIDEIESLALALRKEIEAALQPFYMGHMCLYVTPECFDDPPKTPESTMMQPPASGGMVHGNSWRIPAKGSCSLSNPNPRRKLPHERYIPAISKQRSTRLSHGGQSLCKLLLKDLERIRAKLKRHIEKEAADREAEFEAAMQYHSESDIQEAYGWELSANSNMNTIWNCSVKAARHLMNTAPLLQSWLSPS